MEGKKRKPYREYLVDIGAKIPRSTISDKKRLQQNVISTVIFKFYLAKFMTWKIQVFFNEINRDTTENLLKNETNVFEWKASCW